MIARPAIEVGTTRHEDRSRPERLQNLRANVLIGAEHHIDARLGADAHQPIVQDAAGKVHREIAGVDVAEVEADHEERRPVLLLANADMERPRRRRCADLVGQVLEAIVAGEREISCPLTSRVDRLVELRQGAPDLRLSARRDGHPDRRERHLRRNRSLVFRRPCRAA